MVQVGALLTPLVFSGRSHPARLGDAAAGRTQTCRAAAAAPPIPSVTGSAGPCPELQRPTPFGAVQRHTIDRDMVDWELQYASCNQSMCGRTRSSMGGCRCGSGFASTPRAPAGPCAANDLSCWSLLSDSKLHEGCGGTRRTRRRRSVGVAAAAPGRPRPRGTTRSTARASASCCRGYCCSRRRPCHARLRARGGGRGGRVLRRRARRREATAAVREKGAAV